MTGMISESLQASDQFHTKQVSCHL